MQQVKESIGKEEKRNAHAYGSKDEKQHWKTCICRFIVPFAGNVDGIVGCVAERLFNGNQFDYYIGCSDNCHAYFLQQWSGRI